MACSIDIFYRHVSALSIKESIVRLSDWGTSYVNLQCSRLVHNPPPACTARLTSSIDEPSTDSMLSPTDVTRQRAPKRSKQRSNQRHFSKSLHLHRVRRTSERSSQECHCALVSSVVSHALLRSRTPLSISVSCEADQSLSFNLPLCRRTRIFVDMPSGDGDLSQHTRLMAHILWRPASRSSVPMMLESPD